MDRPVSFSATLWETSHENPWFFVTVPPELSDEIEDYMDTLERPSRGFGSVKVSVRIGRTEWSTSLFPDSKLSAYVLPVKKAVRDAERIDDGDTVEVEIAVIE